MLIGLLRHYGLDTTKRIKLVRHKDNRIGGNMMALYEKGQFELYQSYQAKEDFKNCDYLISFIGIENSQALLVGVYEVMGVSPLGEEVSLPQSFVCTDEYRQTRRFYYELRKVAGFEEIENRLIIEWSGGAINWCQSLSGTKKEVVQLLPKGYVGYFPGYLEFFLSHYQLCQMIRERDAHREWHKMLSAVGGVYVILDTGTGDQYIGSAYGKNGILGRFETYAKGQGGGNKKLVQLIESDPEALNRFQYSLLETFPAALTLNEAIARENLYKKKLGTRVYGLNSN